MDKDIEMYFRYIVTALDRILASLDGLTAEQLNWEPIPDETSSLYVLAVHTMGNVEQGVLATLAGHPDYRDRDAEFASVGESPEAAQEQWRNLKGRLQAALGAMSTSVLDRHYEHPRRGPMNGWEILLLCATHANEHVGHAELTRQLVLQKG